MPMIKDSLQSLGGRTLNSTLSPDQSIAHGAAYYAGMLLANRQHAQTVFNQQATDRLKGIRQKNVNARALGILIRNTTNGKKVPHYLIPANTPLPAQATRAFGTVVDHQTRVHVKIVESGAGPGKPHTILGDCMITDLPTDLPEGSEVDVTISYDHEARVHIAAKERQSGKSAEARLVRPENISGQLQEPSSDQQAQPKENDKAATQKPRPTQDAEGSNAANANTAMSANQLNAEIASLSGQFQAISTDPLESEQPIALCNFCAEPLHRNGHCTSCGKTSKAATKKKRTRKPTATGANAAAGKRRPKKKAARATKSTNQPAATNTEKGEKDFWDFIE